MVKMAFMCTVGGGHTYYELPTSDPEEYRSTSVVLTPAGPGTYTADVRWVSPAHGPVATVCRFTPQGQTDGQPVPAEQVTALVLGIIACPRPADVEAVA